MLPIKTPRGGARGKLRAHFLQNIGRIMDSVSWQKINLNGHGVFVSFVPKRGI